MCKDRNFIWNIFIFAVAKGSGPLTKEWPCVLETTLKTRKTMSNSTNQQRETLSVTYVWMSVTFCVCLVVSNIFIPRLWQVGPLPVQLTGAVLLFPISYILNDCLTEVYGYKKARLTIWIGFTMCLFVSIASFIVTKLPKPMFEDSYAAAESFNSLFGLVPRSMIGSLLAFIAGSTVNAWIMSKMKVATKGKGFGWRAIISTIGGEATDSLIFFPIAFGGLLPFRAVISLMFTQVVAKTLYEIVILPVTSWVVRKVKAHEGIDTYDNNISYNPFKVNEI